MFSLLKKQSNHTEKRYFFIMFVRQTLVLKKALYTTVFCLLLICSFTCHAQIDSLVNLIKTDKEDTVKVMHLISLSRKYNDIGEFKKSLPYSKQALELAQKTGFKYGITKSYNSIGIIYMLQSNYPEALKNYFAALNIFEEIKDKRGIASSYLVIGVIYDDQKNYPEALKNYFASLEIKKEMGDMDGIAASYINLGTLYTSLNKIKESQIYLDSALQLSKEIGSKDYIKSIYAGLVVLDSTIGNYKTAFEHHKLFIIYRDSLNNEETQKKSLQASMQYEFDKKEIAVKAEQEKLNAITAEEKKKQQIVIYAVAGVLLLVIVFSLFLFNRFRITQKQKAVIEQQKVLVDNAYESLHEKNKEVIDSINYASRIQRALLPSQKYIANSLNRMKKS